LNNIVVILNPKSTNLENISCYYDEQISSFSQTGMSLNDLLIQRGYGIFDYLRVVDNKPLFAAVEMDILMIKSH
jgi:hypothetical protein